VRPSDGHLLFTCIFRPSDRCDGRRPRVEFSY
jgi:hypothetical protein